MAGTTIVGRLRAELAKHRERGKFAPYPRGMRERIIGYAEERRLCGASNAEIALELGVSDTTVRSWLKHARYKSMVTQGKQDTAVSLVPVVVHAGQGTDRQTTIEVVFPNGTRLGARGITGQDLVDAIQALQGPQ